MASADTSVFSLRIGSLPLDTFRVIEFQGEESISKLYTFRIKAVAQDTVLAYEEAIDADSSLIVRGHEYEVKHNGIITSYSQVQDHAAVLYEFILEPRFKAMDHVSQSRIFQNLTPVEIVKNVLKSYYDEGTFFQLKLTGTYHPREFVVQYNESDLAFVQRLLEDEGISYWFEHTESNEVLILGDGTGSVEPIGDEAIPFGQSSGMNADLAEYCDSMVKYARKVTAKATMKDFNPATPGVKVMGTHENPLPGGLAVGENYQYGAYLNTPDQATRKARLRAEGMSQAKETYRGTGIFRKARAGFRFTLDEGPAGFPGEYLLVKVTHVGFTPDENDPSVDAADQRHTHYRNAFECIPAATVYRPPLLTPRPSIPSLLTALVEGPEDKYGAIDDQGRYKVRFHYDIGNTATGGSERMEAKEGQATRPIRLAQPHAGEGYGLHAPLHKGVEVAIGFVNGDPDRPIALGAIPSPSMASPVTAANKTESVLKTSSGHQIRLDDTEDATYIDITTKGNHVISMKDEEKSREVHIKTTGANELVLDDKNKNIRIATPEGAHLLKMDYDKKVFSVESKYGHKFTMDDEAKKIAVQTKEGHILSLDDDKKLLTLQDGKGKHVFQIDAGGGLISITTAGDMELVAKGALNIEAKEINMEAKQGAIGIKAKQDVAVDAMNVNVKAKQKVAIEAKMDASLAGLNVKMDGKVNVESKAGVQNKMTGTLTNVESQAINTVKGAMVMVN